MTKHTTASTRWLVGFLVLVFTTAVSFSKEKVDTDFLYLIKWFEGRFTTTIQASKDSTVTPCIMQSKRIWSDRTDGTWFYVEQALPADTLNPTMQRIFNFKRVEEGMIEVKMFNFHSEAGPASGHSVRGGYIDTTVFNTLTPKDLINLDHCEIYMQFGGRKFFGGTHGYACKSKLPGVAYTLYELKVTSFGVHLWEKMYEKSKVLAPISATKPQLFMREQQPQMNK